MSQLFQPLNKTTLSNQVIGVILKKIKEGDWLPGEKIPGEIYLSEAFQVSRNSLREALKYLELSGVVRSRAGKGTFLSEDVQSHLNRLELIDTLKNNTTLIELIETRVTIEPQLAYMATKRMSKENLIRLEKAHEATKIALQNNTYDTMKGWEFHKILGEAAENKILQNLLMTITEEMKKEEFKNVHEIVTPEALSKEIKDHEVILNLIKEKKADEVKVALYNHLNRRLEWIKNKK